MTDGILHRQSSALSLRPPETVMRLARLGANCQCRLSFIRILMRRLLRENWRFDRPKFDIDNRGVGVAVYRVKGPVRAYSLVAFAHDLPADQRSDRVIAEAWDATFTLFDGEPSDADLQRLSENVPKQEAGRVSSRELTLARANRSVRLFEHVADRLATGQQPDAALVEETGYLMRTTAVYGSGKFGAADHASIANRPEFEAPFQAEMLTVYLIRAFALDLVEHMADCRSPDTATTIDPGLRRRFGIGNSTGLGMAPFVLNHPMLINNWITARETALARVRAELKADPVRISRIRDLTRRAGVNAESWQSAHPLQQQKLTALRSDLSSLNAHLASNVFDQPTPWDRLYSWVETNLSVEGQEHAVSLLIDAHGDLTDDLAATMSANETETFSIDGAMSVSALKAALEDVYGFALAIDWADKAAVHRVWYVSAEKLEPRMGQRFEEEIEAYEQPLAPARDAARMHADLANLPDDEPVAACLMQHPEHRHMARRAQQAKRLPYAEIRDNTIGDDVLPIYILRCKLAFFGAARFDPRSDRWVRINMFQGAPFFDELAASEADDWMYPAETQSP